MCFLKEIQNNEILATSLAAYYSHGLKLVHKRNIEKCANETKSEELEIKKRLSEDSLYYALLLCALYVFLHFFYECSVIDGFTILTGIFYFILMIRSIGLLVPLTSDLVKITSSLSY